MFIIFMDRITPEKLEKYFSITSRALAKVKITEEQKKDCTKKTGDKKECLCEHCKAHLVFDMAKRYFDDAKHFKEKGDIVTAFAALNYAHGWLDAGARLGLFDVGHDSELFTVD